MNQFIKYFKAAILYAAFFLSSCSEQNNLPPDRLEHIDYTPQPVVGLHSYFADASREATDSAVARAFLNIVGVSDAQSWASSPAVSIFTPAVDSVFGNNMSVEKSLGHILDAARAYGVDLPKRRYATVVHGRPEAILFIDSDENCHGDSMMFVALNHYLGADYPGYGHLPSYRRADKTPERLPYDLAEALVATSYPFVANVKTNERLPLLSRLVYEGALIEAKMRLVEDSSEAAALGYDDATYRWLQQHERAIWEVMVSKQFIYNTSALLQDRIIGAAPSTAQLLVDNAPGRAGRFIGYKIIRAYLDKKPDTSLAVLLSPQFYSAAQDILAASEYSPEQ